LNAGDNAKWFERTAQGNGHMQAIRSLGYVMVCADEKACGHRQGQAYMVKRDKEQQAEAQANIDMMRSMGQEVAANALVAHYAGKGIVVS
jgi:hypothetical protein